MQGITYLDPASILHIFYSHPRKTLVAAPVEASFVSGSCNKSRSGQSVVVATIGCALEEANLVLLESLAQVEIDRRRAQMSFDFEMSDMERKSVKAPSAGSVRAVDLEIILDEICVIPKRRAGDAPSRCRF